MITLNSQSYNEGRAHVRRSERPNGILEASQRLGEEASTIPVGGKAKSRVGIIRAKGAQLEWELESEARETDATQSRGGEIPWLLSPFLTYPSTSH